MDVRDALLNRRTVHTYRRDAVPDEAIERALEAAIHAPNHRLTFPWRFTRVGRKTRAVLADIAVRLKTRPDVAMTEDQERRIRAKVLDPADLVAVSVVVDADPAIAREDYASAACAIQNLCLSLFGDGIASKWSTGNVTRDPETYAHLGLDPAREEIVGFVWVGLPATDEQKKPQRPGLADLVRRLP